MKKQQVSHDFEEIELEIETMPGEWKGYLCNFTITAELVSIPARISGPPENCHPDESEVNILSIELTECSDEDNEPVTPSPELRQALCDALDMDEIYEVLWGEWQSEDERRADREPELAED